MSQPWTHFDVAYITIELESAFLVAAGDSDRLFDAVFVTDANGLPCIPGESIAGVLRHSLAGDDCPEDNPRCRDVFGYQSGSDGQSSRVRVSYGHVHGQNDQPVPFRGASTKGDPVLAALRAGVGRDHVRIGKNGAAENSGKFDELLIPAGARFTFELMLSKQAEISIEDFVALLSRPEVRIGGKTRRGMGQFRVIRASAVSFDLARKEDLKRLGELPVALEKAVECKLLKTIELKRTPSTSYLSGTIHLEPVGTWMIGGGSPTGREPARQRKAEDGRDSQWDRVPLSEARIEWSKGGKAQGQVTTEKNRPYLLPASSIKGAIRHRTAFHARRLKGDWYSGDPANHSGSDSTEVQLFGDVRNANEGKPGLVYFSDVYLSPETQLQALQHVSLDRFTQGPMDHLLYDELALIGGKVEIGITIDASQIQDDLARAALAAALDDLCEGRLPLGAGRGHGRFKGEVKWHNNQALLAREAGVC